MHVVYEALTEDGRSAYVGVTSNLPSRIRTHKSTAQWFMAASAWRVLAEFEDRREAEQFEWDQITARRPLFNTRANPDANAVAVNVSAVPANPHINYGQFAPLIERLREARKAQEVS